MKRNYLLIFIQIILTTALFSTSLHTIPIDGNNSDWDPDETFTNCSAADNAYFTWDEDFIYIGIYKSDADYGNMATFVYFDTDPTSNNGTSDSYAWVDYINTPFKSDFVIVWKNQFENDYIEVRSYNNTTGIWDQIHDTTSLNLVDNSDNTLVKFAVQGDTKYREVKISRSLLLNPTAIKTCMFTEQQWGTNWRYYTWPSDDWEDKSRGHGQSIPNYYGFLLEENISITDSVYFQAHITGFTGLGKTSLDWNNAGNWSDSIPDTTSLVLIPTSKSVEINELANCYIMNIESGGTISINPNHSLTIHNNLYNDTGSSGLVVQSTPTGNGSLIIDGIISGDATVQNFVSAGQWHSWAAPVTGLESLQLYLNATPEVWLTEYNEIDRSYTYIEAFDQALGDMKGWMLWVGGTVDQTYNFEGPLRSGTMGSDNNMVRSATGDYGFNYVGNPFPSAIDWLATSGWNKTNLNNAIYLYHNGGWATYINGAGAGGGSQYIAMNQGFFVQVTDGSGPYPEYGTLKMNNDVCVHNSVNYLKNNISDPQGFIRLQLTQNEKIDDAVIRFNPQATEDFDGEYDALKFSSYVTTRPQIYSITNDRLAINTLPPTVELIEVDVKGADGQEMTISMTEVKNLDIVYLKDDLTGIETNLSLEDYSFTYDQNFTHRFTVYFTITDINEINKDFDFTAYSENSNIKMRFPDKDNYNISITNILGQEVYRNENVSFEDNVSYMKSGVYLIKIASDNNQSVKKIIVK